uniref:Protein kinase domain-containing protein n=1 Tax=Rhodotorula toruloides TaxID=5286 RepID=A0A0K3CHV8_RHOTO
MTTLLQLLRSGLHPPRLPFPVPPAPEDDGVPQPAPAVSYDEEWMPRHILQIDSLVSLATGSFLYGVSNRLAELGKADPVVPADILQGFEAGFRWFARRLDSVREEDIRVAIAALMQPLLDLVPFIDETLELPTDYSEAAVSVRRLVPIPLTMHSALLTDVLLVRRTGDFQGRRFMSSGTIERPPPSQATSMPLQQRSHRLTAPISYEERSSGRLQRLDTLLRRPRGLAFSRDKWESGTEVCTLVYQASLAAQAFLHCMFYFTDASNFSIAFNCFFGDARVIAISPLHTLSRPASVAPEAHPSFLLTILASFFPTFFPHDPIRFGRLIRRGTTSEVWEGKLGDSQLVVKYVHGQLPSAVQHLLNDRDIFAKFKPAIDEVGVGLEGLWQSEIGDVIGVGPYGGQSPEQWSAYTQDQRLQVFLKLLILHQRIGLIHGGARPSATVITKSSSGSDLVRWVDISAATEHAEPCGGLSCNELRRCLMSMCFSGEMLDKLRDEVEALGLIL